MSEEIAGQYMSGETTRLSQAKLRLDHRELIVSDGENIELTRANINEIKISVPVGKIPRRFSFPDQSHFETEQNQAIDDFLRLAGKPKSFIYSQEGKLHFILPAILIVALSTWLVLVFGLPFLAKMVANKLPSDLLDSASETTLSTLDRIALGPSSLPSEQQEEINAMIRDTLSPKENYSFQIIFRKGKSLGANAFALPDGSIIFTDELIRLLKKNEEIFAVFAHELGHVVKRHSLRQLLQSTSVALISYLIIGESTDGMLEAINALPALLMNSSYSREFESEADDYAIRLMLELNIPTYYLGNALEHLSQYHSSDEGIKYLSSHPPTEERILKTKNIQKK